MQTIAIIDRGRGPEIAGTRITVFDLLPYLEMGWHPSSVALLFTLSPEEVSAAVDYYREHETEVIARKNTPATEIRAEVAEGTSSPTQVLAHRVRCKND
jgi:uncharacterized protein (DUF433 family)